MSAQGRYAIDINLKDLFLGVEGVVADATGGIKLYRTLKRYREL